MIDNMFIVAPPQEIKEVVEEESKSSDSSTSLLDFKHYQQLGLGLKTLIHTCSTDSRCSENNCNDNSQQNNGSDKLIYFTHAGLNELKDKAIV